MGQHDFSSLVEHYPAVIAQMPQVFTSHRFILKLAELNQQLYIEALYSYRNGSAPFQAVHQQLATLLNNFPQIAERDGNDLQSQDIWTNSQVCSQWRRIG